MRSEIENYFYELPDASITAPEDSNEGVSEGELAASLDTAFAAAKGKARRVLLIVPDFTRSYSNAGFVAGRLFDYFEPEARVELLEALGTHSPMTRCQCAAMYPGVPFERFIPHNWRTDTVLLGEIPASYVREISEGLIGTPIAVEVSRRLFDGYDLIISVGQVVPHEVAGMANHLKNIFVGCGGAEMINASHFLGAVYGMERIMGRADTPVRRAFDYAGEKYLSGLPVYYVLTVTTAPENKISTHGMFCGRGRSCFEKASALAQKKNIILLGGPVKKAVVFLDPEEYKSTWLGNKAVYRTRMAMADGGELIILAPGISRFGEDGEVDALIKEYGYRGRDEILKLCGENEDLKKNLSAAAHLIHGSSEGRFKITYCTQKLSEAEVRNVGYDYLPYREAAEQYKNAAEDGGLLYVPNPALGLWAVKNKFI